MPCSPKALQIIEQLKERQVERRKELARLRLGIDRLLNERQPGGPRGSLEQRRRGPGIYAKLATVERKVAEAEKLMRQLEHACRK